MNKLEIAGKNRANDYMAHYGKKHSGMLKGAYIAGFLEAAKLADNIKKEKEDKTGDGNCRWRKCADELPEGGDGVLLTKRICLADGTAYNRICVAYYDDKRQEWFEVLLSAGIWTEIVSHPLAWMPMPVPYEGDK